MAGDLAAERGRAAWSRLWLRTVRECRSATRTLIAAVAAQQEAIGGTVAFVHAHPELAHEEHRCADRLVGQLRDGGLHVEEGVAGLDTAFRAVLAGASSRPSRRHRRALDAVAAVREDGALRGCPLLRARLIAGAVVGAALALASVREHLAGELVVVGCPADEIHAPGQRRARGREVADGGRRYLG